MLTNMVRVLSLHVQDPFLGCPEPLTRVCNPDEVWLCLPLLSFTLHVVCRLVGLLVVIRDMYAYVYRTSFLDAREVTSFMN